jgi:hypothetical protein
MFWFGVFFSNFDGDFNIFFVLCLCIVIFSILAKVSSMNPIHLHNVNNQVPITIYNLGAN